MRILISTLGKGQLNKETNSYSYAESNYKFNTEIISTPYFPFAVYQIHKPDSVFILMTEKARSIHSDKLSGLFKFNEVIIPEGKNEDEIWEIFDSITQCVSENDEVILDFTFGFRSQPIIAIASLLYLKSLKNIKILNLLYGAYEAKENDTVPVFDLKPFIELIDWSKATESFIKDNNVSYLKNLLTGIQSNTHINMEEYKAKGLFGIGEILNNIINSGSVVRPEEFLKYSNELPLKINKVQNDIDNISKVKPIKTLLDIVSNRFQIFVNDEKDIYSDQGIILQSRIVEFYIKSNQYQQAITLIREIILTTVCKDKNEYPGNSESRYNIEKELNADSEKVKNKTVPENFDSDVVKLWIEIVEIRNDVNHAGMARQASPGNALIENIKKISEKVIHLIKDKYAY